MSSTERLTRSSVAFEIGSRVTTGVGVGKKGVISFIGETQFAAGEWIGLTLDNPDGKNDGSLADVAYFTCKPLHGVFVKRAQVKLDSVLASTVDPKDKLAALREKRRVREAGSAAAGLSVGTTGATSNAGDNKQTRSLSSSLKKVAEDSPDIQKNVEEKVGLKKEESCEIFSEDMVNEENVITSISIEEASSTGTRLECDASEICESAGTNPEELSQKENALRKEIFDLQLSLSNLSREKEAQFSDMKTLKSSLVSLTNQITQAKQEEDNLKNQLTVSLERETENKEKSEKNGNKSREKELEAQMTELMDTLEILTLDKEQLVMDNELLQAQIDEGLSSESAATSTVPSGAMEENTKLREALRRLHLQSQSDKNQLDELKEKQEEDREELLFLREFKIRSELELLELREAVDAASTYESMIESLTERNLEYSQKSAQLETTVRDLEEQQELSEELDQQQRSDLDILRKKLDSANILISEKESNIHFHEVKIDELKKINEKFKRHGEDLRGEIDSLRGQVSISAAESDRMLVKARSANASHIALVELTQRVSSLSTELNRSNTSIKQLKASHIRMESIFGNNSFFSAENLICIREVSTVATATLGSSISQMLLKFIYERLLPDKQSATTDQKMSQLSLNENDENNYDNDNDCANKNERNLPSLQLKNLQDVDVENVRQALLLLRATCICWQVVGCVVSATDGDDKEANISASLYPATSTLHQLFEIIRTQLDRHHNEEYENFDDKIFKEIEIATNDMEVLLRPHLDFLGIQELPRLPLFQSTRKATSPILDVSTTSASLLYSGDGDNIRYFHLSCQSSYLTLGSDLFAAFISSKISASRSLFSPSSLYSATASPLTSSSRLSEDDSNGYIEGPKGITPGPSPHWGVICDMCTSIRTELESIGLLTSGKVLNVVNKLGTLSGGAKGRDVGKEEDMISPIGKKIIVDARIEMKVLLSSCFEQLLGVFVTSGALSIDDVNVSPALMRACLSNISDIKSLCIPQNHSLKSVDINSDGINVINIISTKDIDTLWQLLLSNDNYLDNDLQNIQDNNTNDDININNVVNIDIQYKKNEKWDNIAQWKKRTKTHKMSLKLLEKSQDEIILVKKTLIDTQKELKSRIEELKASKSAYQQLNDLVLNGPNSFLSSTSIADKKNNILQVESSSSSSKSSNCISVNEDVTKLKAEIEVLTSALTVLEIQFEGAEKENKRIRNAGRTVDNSVSTNSKAAVTLAEMVRVWRSIASHRLMDSMMPLPTKEENSSSCNSRRSSKNSSNGRRTFLTSCLPPDPTSLLCSSSMAVTSRPLDTCGSDSLTSPSVSYPPTVTSTATVADVATSTYRELRKLRSRVRVPVTGPKRVEIGSSQSDKVSKNHSNRDQSNVCLGQESRLDRADLIEKFTQSIIYCGGSVIH